MSNQLKVLLERTLEGIEEIENHGVSPSFWDELKRDIRKALRPAPEPSEREKALLAIRSLIPEFAEQVVSKGVMLGIDEGGMFFPITSSYVGLYLDECARKLAQSLFWCETNYLISPTTFGVEYYQVIVPRMDLGVIKCRGATPLEALASRDGLEAIRRDRLQEVEP